MASLTTAGSTSSAPDVKSPYVIKRKPPPSISVTERYPAPDPTDPFAPLWVLRHRTSSALHGPLDPPSPLDFRQRSNSTFNRAATLAPSTNAASSTFLPITASQDAHCRLRSQSTALPPAVTNLTSPRSGHAYNPQPPIANKVHDSDTSGTESDTIVQQHRKQSSPSIRHRSSSNHHRFARLLRSKRSGSVDTKGQGTRVTELGRVRKGSISGPVVSTVVWSTGGQGFVSIRKNPIYNAAAPVPGNHSTTETSFSLSKDQQPPGGILRRGHSHTPISVPPESSLKKRRLSSIHLPLTNRGHDTSHSVSKLSPQRNLRKSMSLAHDSGMSGRTNDMEPTISTVPPAVICSEWELPTPSQLSYAASLPVISEKGKAIPFGSIFSKMRTIVVFIRHFWCPNCQDYMSSLTSFARPEILQAQSEKGGEVQLVIISNGAHTFIKKYRRIFRLPFRVYTDPTLGVYSALGMGKVTDVSTADMNKRRRKMSLDESKLQSVRRGDYAKHGLMSGIAMVVVRALKVGIPLWEKGGDVAQLGGEFVFGPGMTCTYAHRMQSTRGHAPVEEVLQAAYGSDSTPSPFPQQVVSVPDGCAVDGAACNSVGFPCAHRIRRRPKHIKMSRTQSTKAADVSIATTRHSIDTSGRPRQPAAADMSSMSMVSAYTEDKRPKKLPRIPVQRVEENLLETKREVDPHAKETQKVETVIRRTTVRHSVDGASRPTRQETPTAIVLPRTSADSPVEDLQPKQLPSIPVQETAAIHVEGTSINSETTRSVDVKPARQLPEVPRPAPNETLDTSIQDIPHRWEAVEDELPKRSLDIAAHDRVERLEVPVIDERDISISTICTSGSDAVHETVVPPSHEDKVIHDRLLPNLPDDASNVCNDSAVNLR